MNRIGRFLSIIIIIALLAVSLGCQVQEVARGLKAGTYTEEGQGHGGMLKIQMTVSKDRIEDITIIEHHETQGVGDAAIEKIPKAIIEKQSVEVEAISGATVTSKAIMEAVHQALMQAGGNPSQWKKKENQQSIGEDKIVERRVDIVVVGGGAAGLMAALTAAEEGADVILLEKMPFLGGNTAISAGIIQAAGTSVQKEHGIKKDTPQKFIKDLENPNGNFENRDKPLSTIMHEGARDVVEFLRERGLKFTEFEEANARMHIIEPGLFHGGATLINLLKSQAQAAGVEIMLETKATSLITNEKGVVIGVMAEREGQKISLEGEGVILATGGFSSNKKMIEEHLPQLAGLSSRAAKGITGDGIAMAQEIGADTIAMGAGQHMFYVNPNTGIDVPLLLAFTPSIIVNKEGERFINESMDYCEAARAAIEQPHAKGYIVFDDSVRKSHAPIEQYIKGGGVYEAHSISDLAKDLQLTNLVETMKDYNTMARKGKDQEFGRTFNLKELKGPNYYAIEVEPRIYNSYGGLKIDTKARVLKKDGKPIPGLYAGGEVSGSVEVQEGLHYTSGIAQGLVFGRVAAQTALEESR